MVIETTIFSSFDSVGFPRQFTHLMYQITVRFSLSRYKPGETFQGNPSNFAYGKYFTWL